MLLTRAAADGEALFVETATRLLELASAEQHAFRGVVAKMDAEQRGFMERVIREGSNGGRRDALRDEREEKEEPSIALKLNFGGP